MKISKIILYNEPTIPEIQIESLEKFLTKTFPVKVEIRENIFSNASDEILEKIAPMQEFLI